MTSSAGDKGGSEAHEFRHGLPIPCGLKKLRGDQGDGFRVIELEPTIAASPGKVSGDDDEQFFLFAGGKVHGTGLERGNERQRSAEGECGGGANAAVLVEDENPDGGQGEHGQADFQ